MTIQNYKGHAVCVFPEGKLGRFNVKMVLNNLDLARKFIADTEPQQATGFAKTTLKSTKGLVKLFGADGKFIGYIQS